jgi:site-specific DNA-methyltransferase (adenine-specific)
MLKYEWIWEKDGPTGHLNSHFAPMKIHENILIFSKAAACYVKDKSHAMKYFPQKTPTKEINNKYYQPTNSKNYDFKNQKTYISSNNGLKHPTDILKFKRDRGLHPTQKPVLLYQYLLETYTEEGDLALDNVAGSCPLAIAAINTNRRFICIEKNEDYFNIGRERVSAHELH